MNPLVLKILLSVLILGALGAILGLLIGIFHRYFYQANNSTVDEIKQLLPGSNCGGCGFKNCNNFANAVLNDGINSNQCHSIKQDKVDQINLIVDEFDKIRVETVTNDKKDS